MSEGHEQQHERLEREAADLREKSERLGEDIADAKQSWSTTIPSAIDAARSTIGASSSRRLRSIKTMPTRCSNNRTAIARCVICTQTAPDSTAGFRPHPGTVVQAIGAPGYFAVRPPSATAKIASTAAPRADRHARAVPR